MADAITLTRVANHLRRAAENTTRDEEFWNTLAAVAAAAIERPPQVVQQPQPALPFLALVRQAEGYRVIAEGAAVADLVGLVTAYLQERNSEAGSVFLCEVRRVLGVG
jgi:hypothetical protein